MNKIIPLLLFLTFPQLSLAHELSLKLGASFAEPMASKNETKTDFMGPHTLYSTNYNEVDLVAPAVTADFYYYLHENLHIGIGFNTELFRNTDTLLDKVSYFIPYISIKPTININQYDLYVFARLGTAFIHYKNPENLSINTSQDVCYSFGTGFIVNNLVFEFVYSVIKFESNIYDTWYSGNTPFYADSNYKKNQHTYTFNIGYRFKI